MAIKDPELASFTQIDLRQYASVYGYAIDLHDSWGDTTVMRNAEDDKIVISFGASGSWIYYSIRNADDNGTIIDFVQNRNGGRDRYNLGHVRAELRPYAAASPSWPPDALLDLPDVQPTKSDADAVRASLKAASSLDQGQHPYLNNTRGLAPRLLKLLRFQGRILADSRGNAVFPHSNQDGVCGAEVVNQGFKHFLRGGVKGLWYSNHTAEDAGMVVAESAIDCLSYAQLHGFDKYRYFSTGGMLNLAQPALLQSAIDKLPRGRVVIATDNDEGGDLLAEMIRTAYGAAHHSGLELAEHRPEKRGADWNDALIATKPLFPDLHP